ncbi:MAG: nuclear transport factor 2 family protein [Gemmatimonadales bacterium]
MERWLTVVLLATTACTVQIDDRSASQVNDDSVGEDVVRATIERYYDAFSRLDSAAFLALFWPGADVTTAWQAPGADSVAIMIMPVEQFVAQWAEGPGSQPIFEERMEQAAIRLRGDLAQAWVRYTARFGDSTHADEWSGIDAFTLMRVGAAWRIVELAFAAEP